MRTTSRTTSGLTELFELPFGPGKRLFRNTFRIGGARLLEGWQTSFIVNLSTGSP